MHFSEAGQTLLVVLLFAAVFLFGGKLHAPVGVIRRNVISVGAGVSITYIFIQLLPELENAGAVFRRATTHLALPCQGQYGLQGSFSPSWLALPLLLRCLSYLITLIQLKASIKEEK